MDSTEAVQFSVIDFADGTDGPESLLQAIADWLESDEMAVLLATFGERLSAGGIGARLEGADRISQSIFDFRQGGERWEAEEVEFATGATSAAGALIARIYREPTPNVAAELGENRHALVMGARLDSCLLRAELMVELLNRGLGVGDGLDAMTAAPRAHARGVVRYAQRRTSRAERGAVGDRGTAARDGAGSGARRARQVQSHDDGHLPLLPPDRHRCRRDHPRSRRDLGDSRPVPARAGTRRAERRSWHADHNSGGPYRHECALGRAREWTTAQWLQEIRSAIWSMRLLCERSAANTPASSAKPGTPVPLACAEELRRVDDDAVGR
ncbi:hypothetical protein [Mycolicibacterium hippocampi]|uniref:Uncharacterized protein n=1 Tax=Mycolicibacterium hippocampi TaxID=659824 RepID=A0A850PP07_9MYCO|nr:hypothetical protein [Mycolicibacterium hippocampi]NVN52049.1 hypothetical protein [Mycolicibacterium hippocampi]